ncbi:DUF4479 and tRNA-binding domain-containing protein [Streptococcus suis]|nr:DUF4479 and tRNA-binding domain-containing protein [Streptococcus suis]
MIFTYNRQHVGDVLMVIVADTKGEKVSVERKGDVARVYVAATNQTVAWNIFEVSKLVEISGSGQVLLSDEQVAVLNSELEKEGFEESLCNDHSSKFVVGQIISALSHPDSDHLTICQVQIATDKTVQIVAGAPNVVEGMKTIVALPGAMMPSGSLIFAGKLRGEDSFGMMCSPRELSLPNAPQVRGIIELSETAVVGAAFDPAQHWHG